MERNLQSRAKAFMLLFGAVFGLGALLSSWLMAQELSIVASLQNHGIATQGEVYDYTYEDSSRRKGPGKYVPLIRFTTAAGQAVSVRVNAINTQFPRGSYPLLYLPDDPATARVESFVTMWLWSLILSASTAMLLLIAAPMLLRGLKR
jgi:hypothetical protein